MSVTAMPARATASDAAVTNDRAWGKSRSSDVWLRKTRWTSLPRTLRKIRLGLSVRFYSRDRYSPDRGRLGRRRFRRAGCRRHPGRQDRPHGRAPGRHQGQLLLALPRPRRLPGRARGQVGGGDGHAVPRHGRVARRASVGADAQPPARVPQHQGALAGPRDAGLGAQGRARPRRPGAGRPPDLRPDHRRPARARLRRGGGAVAGQRAVLRQRRLRGGGPPADGVRPAQRGLQAAGPADGPRGAGRVAVPAMRPLLVVDAANAIGVIPDGWWRRRAEAVALLRDALEPVAEAGLAGWHAGPLEVVLIVEGAASRVAPGHD